MRSLASMYVVCAVTVIAGIPLALRLVGPNPFYGYRTAKTLADTEIWYRANAFTGLSFVVVGMAAALILRLLPARVFARFGWLPQVVTYGAIALALIASLVYVRQLG
jgi:uncharacterized membrane protein